MNACRCVCNPSCMLLLCIRTRSPVKSYLFISVIMYFPLPAGNCPRLIDVRDFLLYCCTQYKDVCVSVCVCIMQRCIACDCRHDSSHSITEYPAVHCKYYLSHYYFARLDIFCGLSGVLEFVIMQFVTPSILHLTDTFLSQCGLSTDTHTHTHTHTPV